MNLLEFITFFLIANQIRYELSVTAGEKRDKVTKTSKTLKNRTHYLAAFSYVNCSFSGITVKKKISKCELVRYRKSLKSIYFELHYERPMFESMVITKNLKI